MITRAALDVKDSMVALKNHIQHAKYLETYED